MKELTKISILSAILLIAGIISVQFMSYSPEFNFYKSEISIGGQNITEKLYYSTDKEYHTLFRNFVDPTLSKSASDVGYLKNYVTISNVSCSIGNNYLRDYYGQCSNSSGEIYCYSYTENNEYGCSFGNEYGFKEGKEYYISANYVIHPENLFFINGRYYIKFVVYSSGNHKYLTDNNFIVSNQDVVKTKRYFTNDNVIVYIPYEGNVSEFNVISKDNFEFDTNNSIFMYYLFAILPCIILFLSWLFFGKEIVDEDVPDQLSAFPNESRKPWEVSEFFNAPFASVGPNFFATTLLSFYHNKIIDIKSKEVKRFFINRKEMFLRLNNFKGDSIEKQVYELLKEVKGGASKEDLDGDYFNFTHTMESRSVQTKMMNRAKLLKKEVGKIGKEYRVSTGFSVAISCLFLFLIPVLFLNVVILFPLMFMSFILFSLIESFSAILSRFKGNNYIEYKRWQSFKRYLSKSFTIKKGDAQMVKLWDEYLIYSTALGVSKKVIEELKVRNIIDEKQYVIYSGINTTSVSFASSSGTTGGHGGAGGGGVGGGGGGGR